MPPWLLKLLGINWRTTILGLTAIGALGGAIGTAWKAKDFAAIFENTQLLFTQVGVLLAALGLLTAKDKNVTGAGAQAKSVDSSGEVTNVEGERLGRQSSVPPVSE